jgi:DHA2 family lincomycin resistance protein-like MFS transporter
VAGSLLQATSWRWLFLLTFPVCLAALAAGIAFAANVTNPTRVRLDRPSAPLAAVSFGLLIFGASALGTADTTAGLLTATGTLLAAVITGAWFIRRQNRLAQTNTALLDLRVFGYATFRQSAAILTLAMSSILGTLVLLPQYLDHVLNRNAADIGLLLLPGGLLTAAIAPAAGIVLDKYGTRAALLPGTIGLATALWMFAPLGPESHSYQVLVPHLLLSASSAFLFSPIFATALNSVRADLYTHASTVLSTVQQLAGALGSALLIALAAFVTSSSSRVSDSVAHMDGYHAAFVAAAATATAGIVLAARMPRRVR